MNTPRPQDYPRRVLLAVSGLSPQIITETLYALAVAPTDPADRYIPTEIIVVTTTEGAQRMRLSLLNQEQGFLHRIRADYGLPPIILGDAQIQVVHNADGQPLDDIRTEADNGCMADTLTNCLRELTADEDCAVHVSLAGGRKTMGYYAGYALSLFAREQDRLSHVLVSAPFESSWDFFYPTPRSTAIRLGRGEGLADAAQAQVELAEIPFVRLRHGVPPSLLKGQAGFAETVAAANHRLGPPRITFLVESNTVELDGHRLKLAPMPFALLAALAVGAKEELAPLKAPYRESHDKAWSDEVLARIDRGLGRGQLSDRIRESLEEDASGSKMAPHFSRLRKQLNQTLAPERVRLYFDDGLTQRDKTYCMRVAPEAIRFDR